MRFTRLSLFVAAVCCLLAALSAVAQQRSLKVLFRELQEDSKTDEAFRQISQRSPEDRAVKRFLTRNLPRILNAPPKSYETYLNNVLLAGNFRIASAIPGLIGEITCASLAGSTLTERHNLTALPCARALVQIGDPAVPALTETLSGPDSRKHWLAYRALALMNSPRSLTALRNYLAQNPDPALKSEIENDLSRAEKSVAN